MVTMDMSLAQLVRAGKISLDDGARTVRERGRPPPPAATELIEPMPETFAYKVRDQAGQARRGLARGRQRAARRQQAALDGLRAHRDRAAGRQDAQQATSRSRASPDRVKLKDVAVFSRQFATMINSGLSLLRVAVHPRRADREQAARRGRRPGAPRRREGLVALGRAREAPEGVQPPLRRDGAAPVRSAVCSTACCMRLADTIEKQVELRRKVKSAMTYPVVVARARAR